MLDELHIADLGVIEDATLTLAPGLNVLTGETGAGKTMVVTALQLLIGGRGNSDLVRTPAHEALVEARWTPVPPALATWLDDQDVTEAVVSRRMQASGRSRVRIEGALATVGALAETVGSSVEVHAQESHRRLLEPATQRHLLDAWAGGDHVDAVTAHAAAFAAHRDAIRRRDELLESVTARAREMDHLAREVDEIEAAGISEEDHVIQQRIDELAHAEDLQLGLSTAGRALGPDGVGEPLGEAVDALRRLPAETDATTQLRQRLDEVVALATDLAMDLAAAGEEIDTDPGALDRVQERWATLRSLTRKYGPELDDVLSHRDEASTRLAHLRELDRDAEGMDDHVAATRARVQATAQQVTAGRRRAAKDLARAVMPHLADLALEHATFTVQVEAAPISATGADAVAFLLTPNPGQPAVGLADAASGGERSRVALALEVALADVTDARVVVFDEVDAGVGGATAMRVGAKLSALARDGRQVLCVTHLAQLAAWADHHMVVDKVVTQGRTLSQVTAVEADNRVDELARMLGGDTTEAARAHAGELLADASHAKPGVDHGAT